MFCGYAEIRSMTATVAVQPITFEEFERLPEHAGKQELLRGELIELPPAKRRHNEIAENVFIALRSLASGHWPGGRARVEMGYRLGPNTWLVPDVSLTHPGQTGEDYLVGAPALAVEVVSDSNSAGYVAEKIETYLSNGAKQVWVLYPKQGLLWIYRPDGTAESHADTFQSDLLGGATIETAELFRLEEA